MTFTAGVVGGSVAVVAASVPPTDPFGPVQQDPDAVRTAVCKLVASDASCVRATATTVARTASAPSGWSVIPALGWLVLLGALVLVLYVLARALATRGRTGDADDADDADDDETSVDELASVSIDRSREPGNWRREADAHRREGRYRDALRCRYRALVGDLARHGLIDEIPGRTTGEERAQLRRAAPAAAPPFDRAADLFDSAWYGNVDVGEGDDDAFVELERDVLAEGTRSSA